MTSQAMVQGLIDENEIKKLITRLSYAFDERDAVKCRSVFADQVECDIDRLGGAPPAGLFPADELARQTIARLSQFRMTQHLNTMHHVELDGDDATLTAYVLGSHYLEPGDAIGATAAQEPWNTIGARYDMHARRLPEGWRFTRWKWRMMWSRDNHDVWREIGRRMKNIGG
ncbi:MAG: nuclear transport factor 2 family protein [Sphingobium sp.]